jgi:hypothetical protein
MKARYLPLMAALLLAGCSTPKFQSVNPHPIVKMGTGGSPTVVAGVPFWQQATPTRKYAILGYVDDYWRGPEMDEFDFKHLAPLVKKNGGDAGVVIQGDKPEPSLVRQPDETGEWILRLQVIKYL